jgi:signal transduction histidine kinase
LGLGALWWSWRRFSTTPDVLDGLTGLVLIAGGVIVARSPRRQRAAWLLVAGGVAWFVPDLAPLVGDPGWSDALVRASLVHIALLGVAVLVLAPRQPPVRLEWSAVAAAVLVGVSAWTGGWRIALPVMGIVFAVVAKSVIRSHRLRRDWWAVACCVFSVELLGAAIIRSVDSGLAAERWLVAMHQMAVIATVVLLALVEVDASRLDSIELDFDTSADLDRVIADALGVANVEVALAAGDGGWIDAVGLPSRLDTGSGRVVTDERGEVAAALVGVGLGEVAPSNSVRHALGLARDHAQLRATVAAQVIELEASRRRILDAQDEARSEVYATLARGPLAELRSIEDLLAESGCSTDLQRRAARARDDISQLARGLDPLGAGTSLDIALAELVAESPVEVRFVSPSGPPNDGVIVDPAVARTMWFCISEALANVAKHAPGASAEVVVSTVGPHVVAVVSDDGPGGAELAGSGLRGLVDRVEAQGGTLRVDSPVGGGTRVELVL